MKITKENAFKMWDSLFGNERYAEDVFGCLMCKQAYGNDEYYEIRNGHKIYCGWNIHHILPKACGGTSAIENLTCVNIVANQIAGDKITYWIDDALFQVRKIKGTHTYEIVRVK